MQKAMPPFKSLLAFDAAARLGSFSKAAEELSLTQSAVSQQLLKLEESVGQSLFFRNGKGVGLTAAGELLHETVRETLARLAAGLDRIEPYKSKESLLIACPADFAQGWLMPRMDAMRREHPGIEIWFITERPVREIDRIDVDLVISRRPIHTADVECAALLEDYSVALCGPKTAQEIGKIPYPKVLEKSPILMLESEPQWGDRLSATALKKVQITRGATLDDSRLLLEATIREQGISFMSHAVAAQAIREKRVHMLSQVPTVSRQRFWLMRTRLTPRTPFANVAFQWLLNASRSASPPST
jgi:LysR family glycine cleavage system transcriptional activator